MKLKLPVPRILLSLMCLAVGFAAAALLPADAGDPPPGGPIATSAIALDQVHVRKTPSGEMLTFLEGETYGLKDFVVAYVTLNPGQEPHPPHRHADEQLKIVTEGLGTWSVKGKEILAKPGDVSYSAPWDVHGLKSTSRQAAHLRYGEVGVQGPEECAETLNGNGRTASTLQAPSQLSAAFCTVFLAIHTAHQPGNEIPNLLK